jgi:amino-acid N-acetyltransferase
MKIINAKNHRAAVITLLQTERLPADDLPFALDNFVAAQENGELIGVAGIECYDEFGLLRSVAVTVANRNKGVAGSLLNEIEHLALQKV